MLRCIYLLFEFSPKNSVTMNICASVAVRASLGKPESHGNPNPRQHGQLYWQDQKSVFQNLCAHPLLLCDLTFCKCSGWLVWATSHRSSLGLLGWQRSWPGSPLWPFQLCGKIPLVSYVRCKYLWVAISLLIFFTRYLDEWMFSILLLSIFFSHFYQHIKLYRGFSCDISIYAYSVLWWGSPRHHSPSLSSSCLKWCQQGAFCFHTRT
jgi:hypothetical protein